MDDDMNDDTNDEKKGDNDHRKGGAMGKEKSGCTCKAMCSWLTTKKPPLQCPTRDAQELLEACNREYRRPGSFARTVWLAFTRLVGSGGAQRSRLEHIMEFSNAAGYRKIGLAGCARYLEVMHQVARVLEQHGFASIAVACKVGCNHFEDMAIEKDSDWVTCNPLGQAHLLNDFGADLVVAFGLCMGHDLILQHYSDAPVTTLLVKEKITDDCPLQTLNSAARGEYAFAPVFPEPESSDGQ